MIIAKPFSIAAGALPAGGSSYSIGGSKFFLLAASEPLNVQLFRGATLVGDLSGFNGGLSAGPFCEAFTSFSLSTQSGLAGNALIGVGDEALDYNPLAGTLNFSNPAGAATATPAPATISTSQQATVNQQNFGATVTVAAVAGDQATFEIAAGGYANPKQATINKLLVHNGSAAAVNVILTVASSYIGTSSAGAVAHNLFAGGAANTFTVYAQAVATAGLPAPPTISPLKTVNIPANSDVEIDMTAAPIVLEKGVVRSFFVYCDTADVPITFSLDWSEA